MRFGILIAVVIYELVIILGSSYALFRQKKRAGHSEITGDSFALSGRSMGPIILAPTIALTVLGAAHILGVFEMTFGMGAVAMWFSLAHVVLILVACFGTGIWVRRLGVTTVPEALKGMYGRGVSLAIACVMVGQIWGILTLETQGVGIILASMTGWTIGQAAILGGILGLIYVLLAGMEQVSTVNLVNAVVMYVGLIIATIFVAMKLPGGNFDTVRTFYESDQSTAFMTSVFGTPQLLITFALANIIAVTFCQGISQMLMQTFMSAKDEKTITRSVWLAAPLNGMFGVFSVVLGLTARSIPEYAALGPKLAAISMICDFIPGWAAVLLIAALLAAVLSTFAMTSLTPATIWVNDIYKDLINPKATDAQLVRLTRVMIVILGGIAIVIASYLPPILGAINWLFAWITPVFWLFVMGLFWKRHSGVAVATLAIAWILNLAWTFTSLPQMIGGFVGTLPNVYVTFVCTMVVIIVGNLVVKGERGYWYTATLDKSAE